MSCNDYYPHPNSNAEVYRNISAADRAPISDKHLQCISIYNDEKAILGASNMVDRYWSGTVWFYNECTNFNRNNATLATRSESGVCAADFLDKDKFIVGEDSGVLQVLEVVNATDTLMPEIRYAGYVCQHDDGISSLAIFDSKTHFVTSGMDNCIKVWQVAELLAEHSFSFCHTNIITCVDVMPKSDSVFISTSLDCRAIVWDIKQPKPALCLYKEVGKGLTVITWDPSNSYTVAIGADDGSVNLFDIRSPNNYIDQCMAFSRPVHRLKYHPRRNNWLAGCCDDTIIKILDPMNNLDVLYVNSEHQDFVRGLAWLNDELLSCSWDNTVLKHDLSIFKTIE